jgi:hypothetical protein
MQTQSPTFPLPRQGEGLEGRRTARGSYRSAAAVEYQIRLLDRLTSPLRETLSALQRVQAMRFVSEVEGLALEEVFKTAPQDWQTSQCCRTTLRQLA